jgi:hypothetical protein
MPNTPLADITAATIVTRACPLDDSIENYMPNQGGMYANSDADISPIMFSHSLLLCVLSGYPAR